MARTADVGSEEPAIRHTHRRENFPVASLLLPRRLRRPLKAFYRLIRLADDIADDPDLPVAEKRQALATLERGMALGTSVPRWAAPAHEVNRAIRRHELRGQHVRTLMAAFRRDAEGFVCQSWDELEAYCRFSAEPVGRQILELAGAGEDAYPRADALCRALQILNHLQDLGEDYRRGRLYLPLTWLEEAGAAPADLGAPSTTPAVRAAIDRVLAAVDRELAAAADLPEHMPGRRLRAETAVILALAQALRAELAHRDPLRERVTVPAARRRRLVLRTAARAFLS